jgi:putative flavoprotein involved in K+ transport
MVSAYDVIIIGGGQAGLAAAYEAKQRQLNYLVLEARNAIGESWRGRYDSLVLFTPRAYSNLAGLLIEGDPNSYPTKDEAADYLERYADHFSLNIHLGEMVASLTKSQDIFTVTTSTHSYTAQNVIVATGPFQKPRVPSWARLAKDVLSVHSSQYHNPSEIQGTVLIVGGGNSGAQIAEEISRSTRSVTLAVTKKPLVVPATLLGKSIFWWLDRLGALSAPAHSLKTTLLMLKKGIPIIGTNLPALIKHGAIHLRPAAIGMKDNEILFKDGTHEHFDTIIWCTGFSLDYSWLHISDALDDKRLPRHHQGISTTVDGLYFLGLTWQRSINSALLGGVKEDARYLIQEITTAS